MMVFQRLFSSALALTLILIMLKPEGAVQEIHLYGGTILESDSRDLSYTWMLEYMHDI